MRTQKPRQIARRDGSVDEQPFLPQRISGSEGTVPFQGSDITKDAAEVLVSAKVPTEAESGQSDVAGSTPALSTKPKTDRKEYLKLKARERRAADKLNLTVKEYRARKAQEG